MNHAPSPRPVVDVIAASYQGARYIAEFLSSMQAQTHGGWRLWLRDDGSTDGTVEIVQAFAAADARIRILPCDGPRLGAARSFAWLLARVPSDSEYVMCADQDDVWLPGKIERTLDAMLDAESHAPGPVLVHTDLVVVDESLRVIDPSFWRFSHVAPEPALLRRLVVQNVATGATVMLNRSLRELVGDVPDGAFYHDWWFACVAAAFGRIVALHEATVLYRQHGANVVGARRGGRHELRALPAAARRALEETALLRAHLARTTRQAAAFLERYESRLTEPDRRFLAAFARLPEHSFLRRKYEVIRLRLRREHGFWRNLGVLLRA